MRQRYYDPQIRRFINQDILTGNIGESQSMNRYCYVQGNPVSYTDPFGLYPFLGSIDGWGITHAVLDLLGCIPGPVGMIANGVNAVIYAVVDKDYISATLSALGCISCGAATIAARAARVAGKTAQAVRTAQTVENVATMVYHGADMIVAGINMGRSYDAICQKRANGEEVTFTDWVPVVLSGVAMVGSAVGMANAAKNLSREVKAFQRAKGSLADSSVVKGGQTLLDAGSLGSWKEQTEAVTTVPQQLTRNGQVPAIGKMKDLNMPGNVVDGEFKVADYLPDMGNPKDNWKQNSGILRSVMNEKVPIKDVSQFPMNNAGFLGAERNLLQNKGWTYLDGYWYPSE